MKLSILPAPGEDWGPCQEQCNHQLCNERRQAAETPCEACGEPIGYNREYYLHAHTLIHAECLDRQVDQLR